jgi:hypothetical protein
MAEYDFECPKCKKTFLLFTRITERMNTSVRDIRVWRDGVPCVRLPPRHGGPARAEGEVNDQAILYALSTLAQTAAALAAFVGAVGLFRLQILRDPQRAAEFEFLARVREVTGHETHNIPIAAVLTMADGLHESLTEGRRRVGEGRRLWQEVAPQMRGTIYALAGFEGWILFVILISLGGLAHVPGLVRWTWSCAALWAIAIVTVIITGGALSVWLDVLPWLRRSRT